jgi:hypothetical protein
MKHILSKSIPLLVFLALLLPACDKGDGNAEYGIPFLYMPQAMSGGGMDNNYYVPSGDGEYTYNFKIDAGAKQLQVILGVLRSGLLSGSPYTVEVTARRDTALQIVQSGSIADAVLMPADIFTHPAQVSVSGDRNGETFYLSVSLDALARDEYAGKNLVIVIGIANPSHYELYAAKASTVVVVDADAIKAIINKTANE